jgi:hypothetical protein
VEVERFQVELLHHQVKAIMVVGVAVEPLTDKAAVVALVRLVVLLLEVTAVTAVMVRLHIHRGVLQQIAVNWFQELTIMLVVVVVELKVDKLLVLADTVAVVLV